MTHSALQSVLDELQFTKSSRTVCDNELSTKYIRSIISPSENVSTTFLSIRRQLVSDCPLNKRVLVQSFIGQRLFLTPSSSLQKSEGKHVCKENNLSLSYNFHLQKNEWKRLQTAQVQDQVFDLDYPCRPTR